MTRDDFKRFINLFCRIFAFDAYENDVLTEGTTASVTVEAEQGACDIFYGRYGMTVSSDLGRLCIPSLLIDRIRIKCIPAGATAYPAFTVLATFRCNGAAVLKAWNTIDTLDGVEELKEICDRYNEEMEVRK